MYCVWLSVLLLSYVVEKGDVAGVTAVLFICVV